jgi:hypothetical protein
VEFDKLKFIFNVTIEGIMNEQHNKNQQGMFRKLYLKMKKENYYKNKVENGSK